MATANMALLGTFQKHVEDMRALSRCKICFKPFYEPYVLACGHTYCYSCLSSWFGSPQNRRKRKNCPDCRAEVNSVPSPNYLLRDLVHMFISRAELLPEDETVEEHERGKAEESQSLQADKAGLGLFQGAFTIYHGHYPRHSWSVGPRLLPGPAPIRDVEDGVDRCPVCAWELEEERCMQCGWNDEDYSEDESDWPDEVGEVASVTTDQSGESDFEARMEALRRLNDQHDPGMVHSDYGTDYDGMSGPDFEDDYDEEDDTDMDGFIEHDEDVDSNDNESDDDSEAQRRYNAAVAGFMAGHPTIGQQAPMWDGEVEDLDGSHSPSTNTVTGATSDTETNESADESGDDQTNSSTNYDHSDSDEDVREITPIPSFSASHGRAGGRAARVIRDDSEEDEDSDDTTVPFTAMQTSQAVHQHHLDGQDSDEENASPVSIAPPRPAAGHQRWHPYPQRDRSASPIRQDRQNTQNLEWQVQVPYSRRPMGIQTARRGGRPHPTRVY